MAEREERANNGILSALMQKTAAQARTDKSTPANAQEQLFAAVRAARSRAGELGTAEIMKAAQEASETTRKQYSRIIARRLADTGPDLDGLSRASWYPARAALKVGLAGRVHAAMKAQSDAQKGGDYEKAAKLVRIADRAMDQLAALETAQAPPPAKVKNSARQHLPRGSWQARTYETATPAMKPAIAVLWATGCRPEEIGRGVDVFTDKTGALCVRIPGAKVNDTKSAGQPVRVLKIDADTNAGRALIEAMNGAGKIHVQRAARRISKDFLAIRPKLPRGWTVSAYSFRHQAAANMKADLDDPAKVAKAMGHRSTRSQQRYGTKGQAQSGGGAVLDAKATHQPKETRGLATSPPAPRSGPLGPS